jgi:hypothetical protein
MREFRMSGSVEGAVGNRRPYSDPTNTEQARSTAFVSRYTDPNMTLATRSGRGNIVPRWHLRRRRDW